MTKYSIIIPAYNAEKTIQRCLDSIISQHYQDIQIIIINDGSTDLTDSICKEYAVNHPFIKYIRKENEGVSIARNQGLSCAEGEYILFVDSDDYICDGMFETLDRLLKEKEYDYIVLSAIKKKGDEKKPVIKTEFKADNKTQTLKKIRDLISDKGINSPWAKLYKRSIIQEHNIYFTPHVSIAEDKAFNIKYSMYINSIRVSSEPVYTVAADNENSLSRKKDRNLEWQFKAASEDYENELEISPLSAYERTLIKQGLDFCSYRDVYSNTKRMIIAGKRRTERKRFIKKVCKDLIEKKRGFPFTLYALMIVIPVKLKMWRVIDFAANRLTKT